MRCQKKTRLRILSRLSVRRHRSPLSTAWSSRPVSGCGKKVSDKVIKVDWLIIYEELSQFAKRISMREIIGLVRRILTKLFMIPDVS